MNNPLSIYLHDHLAGSRVAIDLLENMREEHTGERLGNFAAELVREIEEDRSVLQELIERTKAGRFSFVKEGLAWLGEKVTRMKLRRSAGRGLGTIEALETLSLGILGKLALWRALTEIAPSDNRLYGVDFERLAARAQAQHARVEARRLEAVRTVFSAAAA